MGDPPSGTVDGREAVAEMIRGGEGSVFRLRNRELVDIDVDGVERIVPVVRNDAHKLIEECMIAANVAAARFLGRHKMPTLYRIHATPAGDKVTDLQEFLNELGLGLRGGRKPSAKDYSAVLEMARGRPDEHLINTVLLRSMPRAEYNPDNIGHFGLAHEDYAHFTSPIRRYPDLLVHRAIRYTIEHHGTAGYPWSREQMDKVCEKCSHLSRRAEEARSEGRNQPSPASHPR
mgnify:CR=1 FL=1